jgi:mechanosensitive ion channel-like protein
MQSTSIAVPVRNTAEAIRVSLANAVNTIVSVIPRLLGFAVILIAGWLVSSLLARGVTAVLRAVRFNDLARKSGFAGFVQNMGVRQDAAGVIASIVKWFVRLITLVVAFDMLGLPAVSAVLQQFVLWLPNLIVALVVLVIGGLAANALSRLVRGATAEAGFSNADVLATVTRVVVWSFAIVVAVNQLGIATTLINTLLVGVVGALALATGLAFGLGGRDRAAEILERMSRRAEVAGPRLEPAVPGARDANRTVESARTPVFEENWVPRSGADRRRVARPGPDRRTGGERR